MKKLLLLFLFLLHLVPSSVATLEINNNSMIQIEIKGHVKNPGVMEVKQGTTIQEIFNLIELYEDSDLRGINLNQVLHHQDVLVIPVFESHLISINSASLEQLVALPGIGETTAMNIIAYRTKNPFQKLEDLMNVKGIGQKKFDALKDLICL